MQACKLVVSIVALTLMASCATADAARISGESINSIGQAFVQVSDDFSHAHAEGKITDTQYQVYKEFGVKFKTVYPIAIHLYAMGMALSNNVSMGEAVNMLASLEADIARFAAELALTIKGQAP